MLLAADAVAPVAGAALTSVAAIPHRLLGGYLGFLAGFLMYLASADILLRTQAGRDGAATLTCTIAGLIFMLLIAGLAS